MRNGLLTLFLGLGLGLGTPGPSQAQGDMDLEIPIYIGTVTRIDAAARTLTVGGKRIHVPESVVGFEDLVEGTRVAVQVRRDDDEKLVATAIHLH